MRVPLYLTIVVLCLLSVFFTGCVSQSIANRASILSEIYTAPIGGFEITNVIVDQNSTFETDYLFYSRNWGPGEVKYVLSGSYRDKQFGIDPQQIRIEPSNFTAEPNHTYRSRLFLNTSALPKEFKPRDTSHADVVYPVYLNINVSLEAHQIQYGDDRIVINPALTLTGPFPLDQLSIANCSIHLKRGETRTFTISYQQFPGLGVGTITEGVSQTPLNISITPSEFISKQHIAFPSIVTVTADPSLTPGEYPFVFSIKGSRIDNPYLVVQCNNGSKYVPQILPQVNVTVS